LLQVDEHVLCDDFIERAVAMAADLDGANVLAWQESVLVTLRMDQFTGCSDVSKVRRDPFGVAHHRIQLINRTTRRADRLRCTTDSGVVVAEVFEETFGERDELAQGSRTFVAWDVEGLFQLRENRSCRLNRPAHRPSVPEASCREAPVCVHRHESWRSTGGAYPRGVEPFVRPMPCGRFHWATGRSADSTVPRDDAPPRCCASCDAAASRDEPFPLGECSRRVP
jgi:hypothetical protein